MSSATNPYVLAAGRSGHERLRLLSEICDLPTRQLLTSAGLTASHRAVEFGCGVGHIARWMATQAANVTGVDISDEHLQEARRLSGGLSNLNFLLSDIYEANFPADTFDYAYCRLFLVHLPRPVEALRKMSHLLKRGGYLICEEPDLSSLYTEPPCQSYHRMRDLAIKAGTLRGVNYSGGRELHIWAREAGFEVISVDAYQQLHLKGAAKRFWSWTFAEAGDAIRRAGSLTEEEFERLCAGMRQSDSDPDVLVGHCRIHQLIAKKPN